MTGLKMKTYTRAMATTKIIMLRIRLRQYLRGDILR